MKHVSRLIGNAAPATALTIGLAGLTGCGVGEADNPYDLHPVEWRKDGFTALVLEPGAKLRSGPVKNDTDVEGNLLEQTHESYTFHLPGDATELYSSQDNNGVWYCIKARAVEAKERIELAVNPDQMVCVNDDRAYLAMNPDHGDGR